MARIVPAALALLLCAALAAGCSDDADDPLEYADDAIASSADLGAATLTGARLHEDIALVPDEGRLAAIDLSTGQSRWSADDGEPLLGGDGAVADHRGTDPIQPVIRETGDDWQVLITYRKPVGEVPADRTLMYSVDFAYGVAALSGEDGHVEWLSETVVRDGDVEPEVRPLFADQETVVAASVQGTEAEGLTAWAFDAKSGETRWNQQGVWPSGLSGDVVTVEEGVTDATVPWSREGPERENASVRALDTATGEPEWDVSEEFETSIVDAASEDYLVIRGSSEEGSEGPDEDRTALIDPETGEAIEEIGSFELCYSSEDLIACEVDGELLTYRAGDQGVRAESSEPLDSSSTWDIKSVIGQTVFIQEDGDGEPVRALDAEGRTRAEELPALPADLNDDYAVFCTGAECQVHAGDPDERMDKATETDVEALDADDDPLWGRRTLDDRDLSMSRTPAVDLVQDAVVVHGEAEGDDVVPILVVEADNGEASWKVDESERMREDRGRPVQLIMSGNSSLQVDQIAEHEDGWSMLLPAMSGDESGVAALDGASGELSWFLPLAARDERVSIRAAGHGHAAIEIDADGATSTAIVDLEQHEELWRQPDTRPLELTRDSVVVQDLEPGEGGRQTARGLSLLSLDGDPESRWSMESENTGAALIDAGHGLAVVGKTDGTVILDAASGEELRSIGRRLSDCATGSEALLCLSTPIGGDGRDLSPVLVEPADDGVTVRELRDVTTTQVTGAYGDRFFLQDPDDEQHRTIDENGIEVDTELPGTFQEANEDGLALVTRGSPMDRDFDWEIRKLN